MRASGTRAGTPAFPGGAAEQVGESCGPASRGRGRKPRAGWGGPSVQWSGLHFCSPASQTRPSPSGPTGAQPGRGRRRSAPKPPPPSPLPTGVLSRRVLRVSQHLTPCMARALRLSCLCDLGAGELWPCGLALSSTVPWPGLWLLCLFQKPGPWDLLSVSWACQDPASRSGPWPTDAALGCLSPAHLSCCPLYHTRRPRLLCRGLAPPW